MSTGEGHIVVIGLGNPLMGDDGFGLAVLARLRRDWELGPSVRLVDGGTWGMTLLPDIEEATAVILVDTIDQGWTPGMPVELERDDLPMLFTHKLSPHQVDLRETLAAAELRGRLPLRTVAIGVQPQDVSLGMRFSPPVAAAVGPVAELVVARLHRWHAGVTRREPGACTS